MTQQITENGILFELREDGTAAVVKYLGKDAVVTVPQYCQGHPVTVVAKEAFANCATVTQIYIPEGVTEIQNAAFSRCLELSRVYIPASVTKIGDGLVTFSCPGKHMVDEWYAQWVEYGSDPSTYEDDCFEILYSTTIFVKSGSYAEKHFASIGENTWLWK